MNTRTYGKTKKQVSEIGFGSWQLGNANDWSAMTDQEAISLVHNAINKGVTFFDTSPNYGLGNSERLLGKAIKNKREQVVINTKCGHHANGTADFSIEKIRESIESSLKRLQTDYLDSVLLHNPDPIILQGNTGHFELFETLKKEGKILDYGASVDTSHDMKLVMENSNSGIIETMFNIFHQETRNAFSMANKKGIGIIVKVPLDSGFLTGKYNKASKFSDIRSRWSKEVIERRVELLEKIEYITDDEFTLAQRALQFVLAHPEVSTVIPGNKNIKQLTENVKAASKTMPEEMKQELIEFWSENIKNNPLTW